MPHLPSYEQDTIGAAATPPARRARLPGWLQGGLRIAAKLAYPVVILCAWHWDSPRFVGCLLFALLWLQRLGGTGTLAASLRRLTAVDWCVAALLNVASAAIVLTGSELLLRLYPSLVNLGLLVAFGATLVHGPSMVEKFARITMPDPPPHVIRYTRRVTQVWCVFFVLNGGFSVYTALWWSRESWSLYNGAIAYGLIGALLAGELGWRHLVMLPRAKRAERAAIASGDGRVAQADLTDCAARADHPDRAASADLSERAGEAATTPGAQGQ